MKFELTADTNLEHHNVLDSKFLSYVEIFN